MKCGYCNFESKAEGVCPQCGAPMMQISAVKKDIVKSDPIFYNGYNVIMIRDYMRDEYEIQFWLGCELQERFKASIRWMQDNVKEGEDPLPVFWDLFLLARGEKEVLYWKDKNDKPYITFEVRRIDNTPSIVERL